MVKGLKERWCCRESNPGSLSYLVQHMKMSMNNNKIQAILYLKLTTDSLEASFLASTILRADWDR